MSRPAAPSYPIRTWATDAAYPAGADPWSGQPTKVEPPSSTSGFVPDQGAAAEYFNKLMSDALAIDTAAKATLAAVQAWAIDRAGLLDVRNWFAPQSANAGVSHVRYSKEIRKYYGCGVSGGSATFARTADPQVWATANELGAFDSYDGSFDVAADGSLVIPGSGGGDGAKVYECTPAGVWTIRAAVFATALIAPDCVFEPVSGNWIVVGQRSGSNVADVYTSTNRTAWTSRTAPTGIPTFGVTSGPYTRLGKDRLGKTVAQFYPASIPGDATVNSISFSCSSDGGVTWSSIDTHFTAFPVGLASAGIFAKPVWTGSSWVAVVSAANSGATTNKTYVFNSTTGVTWTQVALLNSIAIRSIAANEDGIILGTTAAGALIFSTDNGATWLPAGISTTTGSGSLQARATAANGGFVIADAANSKVRHSVILGSGPSATPLT